MTSSIPSKKDLWKWFGDHGTFIGGVPLSKSYNEDGLTDPARTPFDIFYISLNCPVSVIALRLRPNAIKDERLHDRMEHVLRRSQIYDVENENELLKDVPSVQRWV